MSLEEQIKKADKQKASLLAEIKSSKDTIDLLNKKLRLLPQEQQKAQNAQKAAWLKEIKRLKVQMADLNKALQEKIKREDTFAIRDAEKVLANLKASNQTVQALSREAEVTHYNLGVLYTRLGQYREAATEFEYAIALNKNDGLAHYNLAVIYDAHLKEAKAAIPHYEAYIRLLPKASDASEVQQRLDRLRITDEITSGRDLREQFSK